MSRKASFDPELEALKAILGALEDLDDNTRLFVLRTVIDRLGLGAVLRPGGGAGAFDGGMSSGTSHDQARLVGALRGAGGGAAGGESIKQFVRAKKPQGFPQRIAVLAYYLTHHESKATFKTTDITSANTRAAGEKFSNPSMFVDNATRQARFLTTAGKGQKQITALGEEVVDALPNQEMVSQVIKDHGSGKRKGAKRKRSARSGK